MYDSHAENELDMYYLFVYGSLRNSYETGAHHEYLGKADFISPAKIRGQLYKVNHYAGLVLSETEHWAIGEIYLLADESQLHSLDVYESCAKKSPQPHEYERRLTQVVLASGEALEAWVYVYKQQTDHLDIINSGDFFNY